MRWKIDQFYFDENSNVIHKEAQEVLLEPKVADLLRYFCQNPQRAISRDELIEHVWLGQIVSDSAINRIVVKLRKTLEDNDKIKRFIVTVPKVGYRFAVKVEQVETPPTSTINQDKEVISSTQIGFLSNTKLPYIGLCLVSLLAIYFFLSNQINDSKTYTDAKVSPLSRLSTTQFEGAMSTDQRYLAFSAPSTHGLNQLHIQDNHDNITHIVSPAHGNAYMPYWSDDGRQLFYLFYRQDECEIHQLNIQNNAISKPKAIYQCVDSQIHSIIHHPSEQSIVFVERVNEYAPWQVYSMSLTSENKRKVAQPIARGRGNYHLDRNRETDLFLLLHESKPGISEAFELDIKDNTYQRLVSLPYTIDSALWGHDGQSIIHPGEHPSFDLVKTDLDDKKQRVLYSDSRRIAGLNKINNGKDYLFTSYIVNRDIQLDGNINRLLNSSVMDYLPALSNKGEQLAFISKRTGYSKLWIQQIGSNQLQSIEMEDRGRIFYQLVWSYDDQKLLANTDKGLIIYDIKSKTVESMIDLEQTAAAAGWFDDSSVHFSQWGKNGWNVTKLELSTLESQSLDESLAFVLANKVNGAMQYIYFDQALNASWNGNIVDTSMCSEVLRRYRISWQFKNNRLHCLNTQGNAILALDNKGNVSTAHEAKNIAYHFDVSDKHWATWKVTSYVSDLIRTNFDDES